MATRSRLPAKEDQLVARFVVRHAAIKSCRWVVTGGKEGPSLPVPRMMLSNPRRRPLRHHCSSQTVSSPPGARPCSTVPGPGIEQEVRRARKPPNSTSSPRAASWAMRAPVRTKSHNWSRALPPWKRCWTCRASHRRRASFRRRSVASVAGRRSIALAWLRFGCGRRLSWDRGPTAHMNPTAGLREALGRLLL